jgi:hypothetical protein
MFKVPEDVKIATRGTQEEELTPIDRERKEINPLFVVGGIVLVVIIFVLLIFIAR